MTHHGTCRLQCVGEHRDLNGRTPNGAVQLANETAPRCGRRSVPHPSTDSEAPSPGRPLGGWHRQPACRAVRQCRDVWQTHWHRRCRPIYSVRPPVASTHSLHFTPSESPRSDIQFGSLTLLLIACLTAVPVPVFRHGSRRDSTLTTSLSLCLPCQSYSKVSNSPY